MLIARAMLNMALGIWWLAILWTYTHAFSRPFDDWKNTLLYVGGGLLIIQSSARKQPFGVTPVVIIVFYFVAALLSIALAPTAKYEGLLELARLIVWGGLVWMIAQLSTQQWRWLMRVTVLSAATIATLSWFQSRGSVIWPFSGAFLAPIGHVSYYSDFMALALVMATGLLLIHPTGPASDGCFARSHGSPSRTAGMRPRTRLGNSPSTSPVGWIHFILWVACMLLIDLGLALSATRSSLVGVVVAVGFSLPLAFIATRSFKKMAVVGLMGALNLSVILGLPIQSIRGESASSRLHHMTDISQATIEGVSSGRWHTYVTSAQIAMRRPIVGWGLGSFRFVYPEFAHSRAADGQVSTGTWYYHPHNEILHQALELGLPGAALFFFGFVYLLYRGISRLRPESVKADPAILITALCGLTVVFVSWQFSTNFLFPVSRLFTALCAGIILSPLGSEQRANGSPRDRTRHMMSMCLLVLSTLLLAAYSLSLVFCAKQQQAHSAIEARRYADWAVRLAPGAFDPLYARAATALGTESPALSAPAVESLYYSYPYVPIVLQMMGILRTQQGNFGEARQFLQHALANDPQNGNAKQLLDQLPPAH